MEAAEEQLDTLVRRYQHRVGFFARKVQRSYMLGSRWNDELVSAGYWGLFKAVSNRRPDSPEREFSAYVSKRIHGAVIDAARTCLTQLTSREVAVGSPIDEDGANELESGIAGPWSTGELESDPEQMASTIWKRSAIRAALERLSDDERAILLAYMEGASLSEIARDHGVAIGTMQGRFRKLAQQLRSRSPELRRVLLDRESC